jgi:hypothetical protein
VIFFLTLVGYGVLVALLVAEGCPVYLALLAPPTVTASAAGTTQWLHQFLSPASRPPTSVA